MTINDYSLLAPVSCRGAFAILTTMKALFGFIIVMLTQVIEKNYAKNINKSSLTPSHLFCKIRACVMLKTMLTEKKTKCQPDLVKATICKRLNLQTLDLQMDRG